MEHKNARHKKRQAQEMANEKRKAKITMNKTRQMETQLYLWATIHVCNPTLLHMRAVGHFQENMARFEPMTHMYILDVKKQCTCI